MFWPVRIISHGASGVVFHVIEHYGTFTSTAEKSVSTVQEIAWNFPIDWRTGQKMGVCIIHQAIQTNMPLLDFNCQISLACVGFERTLISHRSLIYALFLFLPRSLHAWPALNITDPGACALVLQ